MVSPLCESEQSHQERRPYMVPSASSAITALRAEPLSAQRISIQLMPMETLDVAIVSTLPIDGLICTDAEFERWAQLSSEQDEFPWQSKFYRPDTTSTWLGCRVSEPTHLSVVMVNWSEETVVIEISVAVIPG